MNEEGAPEKGIALLGVASNEMDAAIWESMLRAEGIPRFVRNITATSYLQGPWPPGISGGIEVYVPGSALGRSIEILGDALQSPPPDPTPDTKAISWLWLLTLAVPMALAFAGYVAWRW